MSLAGKIAAVQRGELACLQAREHAASTLAQLKVDLRRGATPLRIVVSGFGLGVATGFGAPGTGALASAGGQFVTGPLLSMLLESVLPGLMAGAAAGAEGAAASAQAPAPPGPA